MQRKNRSRARIMVAATAALLAVVLSGCAADESGRATSPAPETPTPAASAPTTTVGGALEDLEAEYAARLGVYAVDTGSGESVEFRADERFAYASTYKALAAAAVLDRVGMPGMERTVRFSADDLVTYSPITEKAVDFGMTLGEIAVAALQYSDNTAGNPLTDELGDEVMSVDREETALNDYAPGDPRDTSTARALAADLEAFAVGDALDDAERDLFADWMRAWPPDGGAPIVLAILSDKATPDAEHDDALIAEAAAAVFAVLADQGR